MNRLALAGVGIAVLATAALLVLSVGRVAGLMALELDRPGPSVALAAGAEASLVDANLRDGDFVTFELCSDDPMDAARWAGAITVIVEAGESAPRERVLTEPVDAEMLVDARRGRQGACVDFARAGPLAIGGHYVVGVTGVAPGLAGVAVRSRIVAQRPLEAGDRNRVLGILLGAILLVVALALRSPSTAAATAPRAWSTTAAWGVASALVLVGVGLVALDPRLGMAWKAILVAVVLGAGAASGLALSRGASWGAAVVAVLGIVELSTILSVVSPGGPAMGLIAGLALASTEVGIAAGLARALGLRESLAASLALERPERRVIAWAGFVAAPVAGVLLRIAATHVLGWVPATGEAPIETYVSFPSGLLSFAALSAIAPVGEEVFFRGLVYGAIRGEGGRTRETLAFLGAWLLFVLAHLPQTFGNWGGLAAIAVAGLGFTTLRAATGSVLVSSIAHLVYNGLLVAAALASG